MRLGLRLAYACGIGVLLTRGLAAQEPLLFDGPPLIRHDPVQLSTYQQANTSPFAAQELPPVPVPISEPDWSAESPAEPEVGAPELEQPAEPPVAAPELAEPVEPPAPLEVSADPEIPAEAKRTEPLRAEPPMPEDTTPDKAKPEELVLPEPEPVPSVAPPAFLVDEPMAVCDTCRSPRRWRLPCISFADLALPTIPQPCLFDEIGLELGGWVEAGFSAAGTSPADRFNGPVTFNDRHAEGQMNQLWFYLEREPNSWACGLDLGGRIDVMYGTDAQFMQARDGLESNWEQSDRFYEMALPQFYLDATLAGWTVRMGKFFTILGYEAPAAPDNFFYSHAYTMQYGEPFTHTGMLVSRRFGQWLVNAGFHRGNDQFDDTDGLNALNLLGGIGYTTQGGWATAEYALSSTEDGPGVLSYTHSIVTTFRLTQKLDYALQGDYGEAWNDALRRQDAWWGINQYFTYTLNPCWAAGVRVEWFRDRDGTRVSGIRAGNQTPTGLAGDFYGITLGMNWTPRTNLRVRPEVRWDIFDPADGTTNKAYDAGNLNRQFMFGCDVIYTF